MACLTVTMRNYPRIHTGVIQTELLRYIPRWPGQPPFAAVVRLWETEDTEMPRVLGYID